MILQTRINHPHWQVNVVVTERLEKAGGKISFLCLSNLSGPSLKTKESNILECWRRFKNVAFLRLTYHVILVQHTHPESSAVLQARVAQ